MGFFPKMVSDLSHHIPIGSTNPPAVGLKIEGQLISQLCSLHTQVGSIDIKKPKGAPLHSINVNYLSTSTVALLFLGNKRDKVCNNACHKPPLPTLTYVFLTACITLQARMV